MDKNIAKHFHISKNSPVPLYFQLKAQLLDLLKEGVFQPGDKLPTEVEFCELLDISRPTVRQAFMELINEGYINRMKAKGTFVAEPKIEGFFFQKLSSFDQEMRSLHLTPSTSVLVGEVITAPEICREVFDQSERVFHLERLRYANDQPMVLVNTYVPYQRFPGIEQVDFEATSLYDVMEQSYDTPIIYVDRSVEARLAPTREAKLLGIDAKQALMHVKTTAYNKDDQPMEFSIADYRGDRNQFKMRLMNRKADPIF